jgi:hypothetical protein
VISESEEDPIGIVRFHGIDITVEYPAGSTKHGTNDSGEKWKRKYTDHYGRIAGLIGGDEEELDCFLRPHPDEECDAYIVIQMTTDGSRFDEEKLMLGYSSAEEAEEAYKRHCHKPELMFGGIEEMDMNELKDRIENAGEDGKIVAVDKMTGEIVESFDDWHDLASWRAGLSSVVSEMYSARAKVGNRVINEDLGAADLWNIVVPLVSFDEYVPKERDANLVVAFFIKEVHEAVEPLRRAIEMCPGVVLADSGDSSTFERTSIVYAEMRRERFDYRNLEHMVGLVSRLADLEPDDFTVKLPGLDKTFEFSEETIERYMAATKLTAERPTAD